MSKYTADGVDAYRAWLGDFDHPSACDMLRELSRRLRQEEEEMRRDPVTDPRPGDRIVFSDGSEIVWQGFVGSMKRSEGTLWDVSCRLAGATIIRRREVQQ